MLGIGVGDARSGTAPTTSTAPWFTRSFTTTPALRREVLAVAERAA